MLEEQLWELLSKEDFQLVVLGTGEKRYESLFRNAQRCYNTRVAALMRYDNAMAHRIYAGADFFLMPSLFEPCGSFANDCDALRNTADRSGDRWAEGYG